MNLTHESHPGRTCESSCLAVADEEPNAVRSASRHPTARTATHRTRPHSCNPEPAPSPLTTQGTDTVLVRPDQFSESGGGSQDIEFVKNRLIGAATLTKLRSGLASPTGCSGSEAGDAGYS
jgi:hypothetical protein